MKFPEEAEDKAARETLTLPKRPCVSSSPPPGSHQDPLPCSLGMWCLGPPRAALSPAGPQHPPSPPGSLLENHGVTGREQQRLIRLRTPGPAESTH
nr:junction-mediating and -regulatory protein-like [Odocoileus virginianus texanus]